MKICIIITTYNRKQYLRKLLIQLYQQHIDNMIILDIIVVVDGSTDGTLEMLKMEFSDVNIIKGDGNWWYTKSINEGFKYAIKLNADYVLTLNDDVEIAHDYLKQILNVVLISKNVSIIGSISLTVSDPKLIVSSGNVLVNKCLRRYQPYLPLLSVVNPVELRGIYPSVTLPGRGMLIPVFILKKIKLFDEKFKQYHSDGDFTLRALRAGYKVYVLWDAKLYVHLEQTSSSTSFLNNSYRVLFKSFFNPVSRNYLPAVLRFMWRHGSKYCYPLRIILFFLASFINVMKKGNKWGKLN